MKIFLLLLVAFLGLMTTACEKLTDPDDPVSVKRARDRAEYVILCKPHKHSGSVTYTLKEVLHLGGGATIPWSVGASIPGPALDTVTSDDFPDWAVMFYEDIRGDTLPTEVQFFYNQTHKSDVARFESLIKNLKQ